MTSDVTQAALEPGTLEHHSSEEEGPADVGVLLHINATDALWIGEITSKDAAAFGVREDGWHMVHHSAGGKTHIAFVPDGYPAIDLADVLAAAISRLTAQSGEGRSGAGEDALREAVRRFLPTNINLDAVHLPDEATIPLDVTMGELRGLRAALNARQSGEGEREAVDETERLRAEVADYRKLTREQQQRITKLEGALMSHPPIKPDHGSWWYPEGDTSSDACCLGPSEVLEGPADELTEGETRVVVLERAIALPDVYAALRVFTDAEKDARGDDEDWDFTLHATEDEARAALRATDDAGGA